MISIETRLKRVKFRANHRGTKEMDLVLGRFADAEAHSMNEEQLGAFEDLLALPDPDIDRWVKEGGPPPDVASIIAGIRRFHGLES